MNSTADKPTVMIVDDTPANLEILALILQGQGYRVAQFPRGAMALRAAANNPPDLILLDIMMPEMDGFEVCQKLKENENLKDIPVIFISALDDTANKVKAFLQGGVDYVAKPFQKEEVLARVKVHISLRRQQIQIASQNNNLQLSYQNLRELEDQRDKLVHMIVHDMRSPLMGLIGSAECLEMALKEAGQTDLLESVETLLASGCVLRDMISTLLDISRMESNQMPLRKESCDLRTIITKARTALGALLNSSTLTCSFSSESLTAYCDPEITRRIVENLIANAVKFSPKNSEIRIVVAIESDKAVVSVIDNGPGIPPEYHSRIFDKFGQVADRKEGKKHSTGLGLTFCKLAAEAHGGQIGLESAPGKGSRFWFSLPGNQVKQ